MKTTVIDNNNKVNTYVWIRVSKILFWAWYSREGREDKVK